MNAWHPLTYVFLVLCATLQPLHAAGLEFTFTLDKACNTSAGVYDATGAMIRTLWRKRPLAPGAHTETWDGTDDSGAQSSPGKYQIKLIEYDMHYVWEGVIGNTSIYNVGPTVHRANYPPSSMAIAYVPGSNRTCRAFYAAGYNEMQPPFHHFDIDPQNASTEQVCTSPDFSQGEFNPYLMRHDHNVSFVFAATDGNYVYWANTGNGYNKYRFVIATKVSDDSLVDFPGPEARDIYIERKRVYPKHPAPQPEDYYATSHWPSCIDAQDPDTNRGVAVDTTGLAVQTAGRLLFVSHGALNTVDILDKTTGARIGRPVSLKAYALINPGVMAAAGNDLWMICQRQTDGAPIVQKFTVGQDGTFSASISLAGPGAPVQPLAVAVSPDGLSLLVAEGGSAQQIKAYDPITGNPEWTFGQPGGYANGPAVTTDKFDFGGNYASYFNNGVGAFIAFQPDGASFWVRDIGTYRCLHYAMPAGASGAPAFLDYIMYLTGGSHSASADAGAPERVYCDFLEFSVNYGISPLQAGNGSWTLVNNWRYQATADGSAQDLPGTFANAHNGLAEAVTLAQNGRTYVLLQDADYKDHRPGPYDSRLRLFELSPGSARAAGGLRDTGIFLGTYVNQNTINYTLSPDGSLRWGNISPTTGRQNVYSRALTAFTAEGNPEWGPPIVISSVPAADSNKDLNVLQASRFPISTSNLLIVFARNLYSGPHLGAIDLGEASLGDAQAWKWRACPDGKLEAGLGYYDIGGGVNYAGNNALVLGRNIICGYSGEFWHGSEANQWFHYYDDGLFVDQFGTYGAWSPNNNAAMPWATAGFAGNAWSNSVVKVNNITYLWHNDESNHGGAHRWRLDGLDAIREFSGGGMKGGLSITLRP